jgi:hypothetical protein
MKYPVLVLVLLLSGLGASGAESTKSYQVTGPIVAITDSVITVQKDDEKWEIARNPSTKVDGKLAVGNRVTVHYKMTADSVEVKDASGKATEKTGKKKKS